VLAVGFAHTNGFGDNDLFVHQFNRSLGFLSQQVIDNVSPDETTDPAITAFGDGSYAISYTLGSGADTDVSFRIVSAAGGVGSAVPVIDQTDNSGDSQVATLTNGNFVVVYQDELNGDANDHDIFVQIFSSTGAPVAGAFKPYADPTAGDDETGPDVAALTSGRFVVVWSDDDGPVGPGVNASLFEANGTAVTGKQDFNVGGSAAYSSCVTALADGGFLVAWEDVNKEEIRAQRYDADGNTVGTSFLVAEGSGFTNLVDATLLSDGRVAFALGDDSTGDDDITHVIFDPRDKVINGTPDADVITSRKDGATVKGRGGDDTLLGQNKADLLLGNGGRDIVRGGNGSDTLKGGSNNDKLFGDRGGDKLVGGKGNDSLKGGKGGDDLIGGAGKDTQNGGSGGDRFIFTALSDSKVKASGRDKILDFKHGQNDQIDLKAIDAKTGGGNNAFTFIGKHDFHNTKGELHYKAVNGNAIVEGDVNGDGKADFAIFVKHVTHLVADDFVL